MYTIYIDQFLKVNYYFIINSAVCLTIFTGEKVQTVNIYICGICSQLIDFIIYCAIEQKSAVTPLIKCQLILVIPAQHSINITTIMACQEFS